jgi:hypothetical protein
LGSATCSSRGSAIRISLKLPGLTREGDRSAAIIGQAVDPARLSAARGADRLRPRPLFRRLPSGGPSRGCCRGRVRRAPRRRLRTGRRDAASARVAPSGDSGCRSSWPARARPGSRASGTNLEHMQDAADGAPIIDAWFGPEGRTAGAVRSSPRPHLRARTNSPYQPPQCMSLSAQGKTLDIAVGCMGSDPSSSRRAIYAR